MASFTWLKNVACDLWICLANRQYRQQFVVRSVAVGYTARGAISRYCQSNAGRFGPFARRKDIKERHWLNVSERVRLSTAVEYSYKEYAHTFLLLSQNESCVNFYIILYKPVLYSEYFSKFALLNEPINTTAYGVIAHFAQYFWHIIAFWLIRF